MNGTAQSGSEQCSYEFPDNLSDDELQLRLREWKLMGYEVLDRNWVGTEYLIGDRNNQRTGSIIYGGWKRYWLYELRKGYWVCTETKLEDGTIWLTKNTL